MKNTKAFCQKLKIVPLNKGLFSLGGIYQTRPFIIIWGPDGSGKTTIALALRNYFKSKGLSVKIMRIRGNHTFMFLFSRIMLTLLRLVKKDSSISESILFSLPCKLWKTWFILQLTASMPLFIFADFLSKLNKVIILERSLLDLVVWIFMHFSSSCIKNALRDKIFVKSIIYFATHYLSRQHSVAIFTYAQETILIKRRPGEASTIPFQLQLYMAFTKVLARYYRRIYLIDTSFCRLSDVLDFLIFTLTRMNVNA